MEIHTPLKLTRYQVVASKNATTLEQVDDDLRDMLAYMKQQEQIFFSSQSYQDLVDSLLAGTIVVKGSLNSWARGKVCPPQKYKCQTHNMSEMFRQSVAEKTTGYVQKRALDNIFSSYAEKPTDVKNVVSDFKKQFPQLKKPSYSLIYNELNRFFGKNQTAAKLPGAAQALKLYACDMHFCSASFDNEFIILKVKLPSSGMTELLFEIPNNERFRGDKISRPTIHLNEKGEVEFCFSVIKEVQEKTDYTSYLGVDIGKVEPFVATLVDIEGQTFSAPFHVNRQVRKKKEKLDRKYELAGKLLDKSKRCEKSGHRDKAETLVLERSRVLDSAARLKKELTRAIANQLTEIAKENNAQIVFEDLRWLREKGKYWNHAAVQEAVSSRCLREGMKVKKVSARNTSQTCPDCGSKVTHYKRHNKCVACHKKLNRDVAASRVIAMRAGKCKFLSSFKQKNSAHTRVSYPSTTGNGLSLGKVTLVQGEKTYFCKLKNSYKSKFSKS